MEDAEVNLLVCAIGTIALNGSRFPITSSMDRLTREGSEYTLAVQQSITMIKEHIDNLIIFDLFIVNFLPIFNKVYRNRHITRESLLSEPAGLYEQVLYGNSLRIT